MINYDSILSAFDGKPTLLQWLKMVKKALDESVLKNVDITQNGEKVVFSFNFDDGTSISTPEVTLPKGDKGDTGATGPKGDTGPKGNDGVSITGINTVSDEVVGDETLTTLRASYSNGTSDEFVVTAKNGSSSGSKIYNHLVKMRTPSYAYYMDFNIHSNKENLTVDDVIAQIPTSQGEPGRIYDKLKIPVCFNWGDYFGVIPITKYSAESGYTFEASGVLTNGTSVQSKTFTFNSLVIDSDTLIGENL